MQGIYFNGTGTASLLPVAVSLAQQASNESKSLQAAQDRPLSRPVEERLTEAVWPEGLANDEARRRERKEKAVSCAQGCSSAFFRAGEDCWIQDLWRRCSGLRQMEGCRALPSRQARAFTTLKGKRRSVVLLFVGGAAHEVFMQDVAGT